MTVDIWGSNLFFKNRWAQKPRTGRINEPSENPVVVVLVINAVYRHNLLEWFFCNPGVSSSNTKSLLTEKIQQLFK